MQLSELSAFLYSTSTEAFPKVFAACRNFFQSLLKSYNNMQYKTNSRLRPFIATDCVQNVRPA